MESILIKNGNARHDGRTRFHRAREISSFATGASPVLVMQGAKADIVIDAPDCAVLPGFVQTHIHLCQTLFRGAADDLALARLAEEACLANGSCAHCRVD